MAKFVEQRELEDAIHSILRKMHNVDGVNSKIIHQRLVNKSNGKFRSLDLEDVNKAISSLAKRNKLVRAEYSLKVYFGN